MPILLSPLARKLCTTLGIDPETLSGSGPRGRIMAADVLRPKAAPKRRSGTTRNDPALLPTRAEKDGYYIYDDEVSMKALADISMPIAVQCEKLLEQRPSLFDYIIRAVVKACSSCSSWVESSGKVDILLFERQGQKLTAIADAAGKSLYRLARETQKDSPLPDAFTPDIIVCDTRTSREQVSARLQADLRPAFAFVARGSTPKEEVRAGSEAPNFDLPYTFYASTLLPEQETNRVASRLRTLLVDPVSLLLLS